MGGGGLESGQLHLKPQEMPVELQRSWARKWNDLALKKKDGFDQIFF